MQSTRASLSMSIVRVTAGILLGIHGYYRCLTGGATGFGGYLDSLGFPAGVALAWAITIFEMTGSLLLIFRKLVIPVAAIHIAILGSGIAMVHASSGWFVVGGGRNGVEYSVLLIACLVAAIVEQRGIAKAAEAA